MYEILEKEILSDYVKLMKVKAPQIAKKAQVERLFLVHLSPRYLDHRVIEQDAKKIFKNTYVPKDFEEIEIKLKK